MINPKKRTSAPSNITVRLPNWMGDLVMSAAFIQQLKQLYPDAKIQAIVKDNLSELATLIPCIDIITPFAKQDHPGLGAIKQFAKVYAAHPSDIFFCLPDSFSSAWMAYYFSSSHRIGYKKELRQLLLTHSYKKPKGLHRVEEYIRLLELYSGARLKATHIKLNSPTNEETTKTYRKKMVFHFKSAASSRSLSVEKTAEIIRTILDNKAQQIVLIGSNEEKPFADEVIKTLNSSMVLNLAGSLSLLELAALLKNASLLLSVDSGPAHLANAFGTKTIVLFGPGNKKNTAPYNDKKLHIIRSDKECNCGVRNECIYGIPQCMESFSAMRITNIILKVLAE